jgi:hypothetical protein
MRRGMQVSVFVVKLDGKKLLVKPRSILEGNIQIYFMEIRWGVMDWIHLPQNRD